MEFSKVLAQMTLGWGGSEPPRSRPISVRFLVKTPGGQASSLEENQQTTENVAWMHISSTHLKEYLKFFGGERPGSSPPYTLCVASRVSHLGVIKGATNIEQFTTKLDTSGKIINVDVSGVSPQYSQYISKDLKDRVLRDLVPQQDVHNLNGHLRETLNNGQSTSAVYRLQISQDKFIKVQTKSKLFEINSAVETDFIMATHTIVG